MMCWVRFAKFWTSIESRTEMWRILVVASFRDLPAPWSASRTPTFSCLTSLHLTWMSNRGSMQVWSIGHLPYVVLYSRGKLLPRTCFTVARGLRRSNLTVARGLRRTRFTVARGLRRTRFTVARGSCDRHLCRKRPPEELFYGRKRILYSIIV